MEDQYHWNETELAYFIRTMDTPDAAKIAGMKWVASYMEDLKVVRVPKSPSEGRARRVLAFSP